MFSKIRVLDLQSTANILWISTLYGPEGTSTSQTNTHSTSVSNTSPSSRLLMASVTHS